MALPLIDLQEIIDRFFDEEWIVVAGVESRTYN